jgi:DNA-binding beta-propeller fold protein YncE
LATKEVDVSISLDLRIGSELLGYRIEKVLGRGGMSVVYLAFDLRLRRPVALKVLASALGEDAAFRHRFLEESQLAASLDHPNVVPIYAAGEAGHELYIAMRYVPGPDLKHLLRTTKLEPRRAILLCAQVAAALDAAHDSGLVHRDVKPSNVLLDGADHVYLADFGLTKRIGEERALEPGLFGTIDYVAPEQIRGEEIGAPADVYALGCLLYECLAGASPFRRGSDAAMLFAHLEEPPPALPGLDEVLQKALAKDPGDRYRSGHELIEDARRALGATRSRRHLHVAVATAAIAGAAGASLVAFVLTRGNSAPVVPPGDGRVVRVDATSGRVLSTTAVGEDLSAVSVDERGVWAGSLKTGGLVRLDPGTGGVLETISVAGAHQGPSAVAAADRFVWIINGGDNKIRLYRPDEGIFSATEPRLATAGAEGCACTDLVVPAVARGDVLWTFSPAHKSLERFVADSTERRSTVLDRRSQLSGIALGDKAVWAVATTPGPALYKLDQQTNVLLAKKTFAATVTPAAVAAGAGAIWVADVSGNAVLRVDPGTLRILARIPVGDSPVALAVGAGSVWVANNLAGTISRIDPDTNLVKNTWRVGAWPDRLAVGDEDVWVALDPPEASGGP